MSADSHRPTLTEKAVEQALEAMRTGQPLSNDHPLRFFLGILFRLQSPEMLMGDAAVQVAVFNHLSEMIIQQRRNLRMICGLTEDSQHLEEDFQQGNIELEVWSLLYYRYVCIERSLTMQLVAHYTNQDERTLRRRHSVGITRLTHTLIDSEQETRRLHRRQRLKLVLPTIYPPSLVGAESLLATSQHFITEAEPPRHLVLHGPAGIGKTALALVLAHRLIEKEAVEDTLWINLRAFPSSDLDTLIHEIISRLDLPDGEMGSLVQTLRAYCFTHRVLFVLDEADLLIEKPSQMEALLHILDTACVIVTSRITAPLSLWTHNIPIPELTREASYKFLEELHPSQTENVLRSFNVIWSMVGGNPLALKLMAGSASRLPLSGALHNIEVSRLHHQIWDELPANQQQMLLLTLLFQKNTVPYDAFQILLPGEPVDQVIEALVSKSLLIPQQDSHFSYTVSALTVSFLLDRVRQEKDVSARVFLIHLLPRQIAFLLAVPSSNSALATLEMARMLQVNIGDCCRYACDLAPQIVKDGMWHTWFDVLAPLYGDCQDAVQKARLAYMMGESLRWLGEFEQAKVYLYEAVTFVEQRSSALVELSVIARYQGYWDDALRFVQDALDSYTREGEITGVDRCVHEIAQIALESGDAITALIWLSRLHEWTFRSWGIASQSYLLLKEYKESLIAAEKALALLPTSHPNRGRALAMLGQIHHEMGQDDQAVEHLLMAVDLLNQAKDTLGCARASNNLAMAYFGQVSADCQISFDSIYQLLMRAYEVQNHVHDEIGLAVTRQNLSWLEKVRKERGDAG